MNFVQVYTIILWVFSIMQISHSKTSGSATLDLAYIFGTVLLPVPIISRILGWW